MPFRLIARLDVKAPHLIKSVMLEGLRKLGDPHEFASRYAQAGIDELLYVDAVASLYGRNQLADLIQVTTRDVFVPVVVAGGIRSLDDFSAILDAGADMGAINTAAIARPDLIGEIANRYGCQALTVSIEAKRTPTGWECYTHGGRQRTGRDAVAWATEAVDRGAGQILVTSVDREGTRQGMDIPLITALSGLSVPLVASGGCGTPQHVRQAREAGADAVAVAHCLHYRTHTAGELRGV
jgi:imidazole glycerol-phosphate synthase subunit HisF